MKQRHGWVYIGLFCMTVCQAQSPASDAVVRFKFNGTLNCSNGETLDSEQTEVSYVRGIEGRAVRISPKTGCTYLHSDNLSLDGSTDFTIQFWTKTTSEKPTLLLSQKAFPSKGITAQKNSGWAIYSSGGTFAWSVGSGSRRVTHERGNGNRLPLTDGQWHQLTLTYSQANSEFRLYYDGKNRAVYRVNFDFSNDHALVIGSRPTEFDHANQTLSEIEAGAVHLQALVDEFNQLKIEDVSEE
jgi:hypothetical protein